MTAGKKSTPTFGLIKFGIGRMNWDLEQLEQRKEELELKRNRLLLDKKKNFNKIFDIEKLINYHNELIAFANGVLGKDNLH